MLIDKTYVAIVFLLALFCTQGVQKYKWPDLPGSTMVPHAYSEYSAVVCESKSKIILPNHLGEGDSTSLVETYKRVRILNSAGQDRATFSVYHWPDAPPSIHARTIGLRGEIEAIPQEDILVRDVVDGVLRRSIVSFPMVENGSEIEWVVRTKHPGAFPWYVLPLQEEIPVLHTVVECLLPSPTKYGFLVPKSCHQPQVSDAKTAFMERYIFTFGAMPPYEAEPYSGAFDQMGVVFAYVSLGGEDLKDTVELDKFYLTSEQTIARAGIMVKPSKSRSLKRKAVELVRNARVRSDSINAVYDFVKHKIGIARESRHEYNEPKEILLSGKATKGGKRALMQSLLKCLGFGSASMTVYNLCQPITIAKDRVFITEWAIKSKDARPWREVMDVPPQYSSGSAVIFAHREYDYAVCVTERLEELAKKRILMPIARGDAQHAHHVFINNPPKHLYKVRELLFPDRYGYSINQLPMHFRGKAVCLREPVEVDLVVIGSNDGSGRMRVSDFAYSTYISWLGRIDNMTDELRTFNPHMQEREAGKILLSGYADTIQYDIAFRGKEYTCKFRCRGNSGSKLATEYASKGKQEARKFLFRKATEWVEGCDSMSIECDENMGEYQVSDGFSFRCKGKIAKYLISANELSQILVGTAFLGNLSKDLASKPEREGDYWLGPTLVKKWRLNFENVPKLNKDPSRIAFENQVGTIAIKVKGREVGIKVGRFREYLPSTDSDDVIAYDRAIAALSQLRVSQTAK